MKNLKIVKNSEKIIKNQLLTYIFKQILFLDD